jgi:hypothetical protein
LGWDQYFSLHTKPMGSLTNALQTAFDRIAHEAISFETDPIHTGDIGFNPIGVFAMSARLWAGACLKGIPPVPVDIGL